MDDIALRQSIPNSVLPYPKGLRNRSKYVFWKFIYPVHGAGRDILLSLGILHHEGRQNYLIGHIAPGRSIEDFLKHLEAHEYANHFIALKDDDEAVSVRRLVDFEYQYHLRIFKDGEVRGHYEYTPESHPKWHMKKVGQESRREEFLQALGDWIVPASEDVRESARKTSSVTRILGRNPF
ncbi:MAG TPA: hypothetical protein VMR99_03395 [Candidatus Paceibacterota bacterium]|nr:hypothetical protein [Candidatus Paceibacterota bacterium]